MLYGRISRSQCEAQKQPWDLAPFCLFCYPCVLFHTNFVYFVSSAAPMVTSAVLKARGEAQITASLCSQKHSPLTPFPDVLHIYFPGV